MATIIGKHGFIGSNLAKKLKDYNEYPDENSKVIYDFGSPTHQDWNDYCTTQAIQRIVTLAPLCKENDILYVFPSSALLLEKETPFTRSKFACEELLRAYGIKHLILRLWPVYGEYTKGKNSAVIDIWKEGMWRGKRPIVWGDGEQERAFIHVNEVVDEIQTLIKNEDYGTHDIKGTPITFNQIIRNINREYNTDIQPKYIPAPEDYSLKSP